MFLGSAAGQRHGERGRWGGGGALGGRRGLGGSQRQYTQGMEYKMKQTASQRTNRIRQTSRTNKQGITQAGQAGRQTGQTDGQNKQPNNTNRQTGRQAIQTDKQPNRQTGNMQESSYLRQAKHRQDRGDLPVCPMDTRDDPEGQLAPILLPDWLLKPVLVPAVPILTCVLSDGRPPILRRCTNQCLATPESSVMPSSSSTVSGTQAGVPT